MAEAIGLIDMAITRAQQLYDRYKTMKGNRELLEKLQKCFKKVEGKLEKLQRSTTTSRLQGDWTSKLNKLISRVRDPEHSQGSTAPAPMPEDWIDNLDELISYFSEAATTLKTLSDKSKSRPKAFLHARELRGKLEELLNDFENLNSKTWLLDNFGVIIQEIRELRVPSTSEDIEFDPTFHVPENPSGVLINFKDPNSLESALKRKVLDESSTVVGAVGAKGASAVAATGMGGVGKTSALRAIGADKEVQAHYSGGVYFFTLGQNATFAEVINMVAAAVKNTGGNQKAKEVSNEQNVRSAMGKAADWFADNRCLFICDNLWRTESKPNSYLYDLKALVFSGSSSCILFSTRDLKIAEEIDVKDQVHFSTRSDNEAASMLRGYAGFEEKETCSNESFHFVLKLCCGLPIALAVAGRSVQRIARTSRDRSLAWDVYKDRLQEAGGEAVGEAVCTEAAGDHEGLFQALAASLEEASKLPEFQNIGDGTPVQVIHRAFCVLRKQTWAPSSMLACLWGVEERKAAKIAEKMELLSLLSIERRELIQKSVLGVTLHDLVHDFCLTRAQENKEVAMWHARLLDGYICRSKLSKENCEKGFEAYNWWSVRLEDDKYVHAHLTYHLAESERLNELESVMLNFRWTYRQLKVNRFLTLQDDFELFRTCQRSKKPETGSEHSYGPSQHDEERNDKGSSYKASSKDNEGDQDSVNVGDQIELIVSALRLSWSFLVSQESEFTESQLAFQVMGRLCSLRCKPAVDKYLRSVERETERPWAKPVRPCLELPRGPAYGKFHMPGYVRAVSVMHGTDFAVAGVDNGNLSILNMKSMETVRSWRAHTGAVRSVVVSGDGRRVVSGSWDRTVRMWNMETGEAVGEPLRGHTDDVMSVAVSGDDRRIVSGSWDGTVRMWNMETGEAIGKPLRGHTDAVMSVAVSGDGRRIVSGSRDRTVRMWNMETGEAIGEPLRGHTDEVRSVAVSGDGRRIVSGSRDGTVRMWNMETGEAIGEPLRAHMDAIMSVAVSGDGRRIVSGSRDGTVRMWNMETGEAIGELLRAHTDEVMSLAVSGDGRRIVSGSRDRTVRMWNMETGETIGKPPRGYTDEVMSVVLSGDGRRIVSGSWDRTVRMWNMETGEAVGEPLRGHTDDVMSVAVSGDDRRIVSGSWDGTVRMWNMETGEAIGKPLRGHTDAVMSVAVSGDGRRIVSGSWDRTVRMWNMETGEAIGKLLRGHTDHVMSVAVSGDGRRIVSGSWDRTVRMWNMETGEAIGEPLRGHTDAVRSVAVSGDGRRIVSGSRDRTVRMWNMETREAIGEPLWGHTDAVRSVAVSGDGRRIVSGSRDGTVRMWNMETGETIGEPLRGHTDAVMSVVVSGDGRRIVSGSWDGTLRMWNMETGEAIGEPLRGHGGAVRSVAVSGDGRRIVSRSWDRTVRMWNMETGEAIGEPLRGHQDTVTSMARSGLLDEFIKGEPGKNGAQGEMESARSLTAPIFCVAGHDGIFYGDIANGTGAMKIGSFESKVTTWLLDAEGKLWAGLGNGTVAVIRTMMK